MALDDPQDGNRNDRYFEIKRTSVLPFLPTKLEADGGGRTGEEAVHASRVQVPGSELSR